MKPEKQNQMGLLASWIFRGCCAFAVLAIVTSSELQTGSEAKLFEGAKRRTVELKNYKRGLFFGSCGPSTRSMQWEYTFTLSGDGPVFKGGDITLKDGNLKQIPVSGGTIALDSKQHSVEIHLKINNGDDHEVSFPYNGGYKLKK